MPTTSPNLNEDTVSAMDRRSWMRFHCELSGGCQPITQLEAGNHWPTHVHDISPGGVGLLLSRRFEPGTLLAVELGATEMDTVCLPLARIRRVLRAGNSWLLGCSWADELSEDDLRSLITPAEMRAGLWRKVRKTLNSLESMLERPAAQVEQPEPVREPEPEPVLQHAPCLVVPSRRVLTLQQMAQTAAQWLVPFLALARFRPM